MSSDSIDSNIEASATIDVESQAELKIKKNQEFLSSVNEIILVIDCEGYILKIPSISYQLYQHYKPQIGQTLYEVFPKAIADTFLKYIQQAFETQQTVKAEYNILIKAQEVWFEVSISPIDLNWVICVINDITARKQAEAELYKSKQLLQIVMDTIPQLIFWKDKQLVYLGCNYNFARAVGMDSPEDVVGKTDYDMTWTKEEADWFQECDRQVMESNTPKLNIIETQLHADGNTWSETNVLPLHNTDGKVVGILGTCEDITERKQAEIELRQSEAQLRQQAQELEQTLNKLQQTQAQLIQTEKMSSLGQMIAGVAHEINNPVSFIYGNLDYADNYVRDLLSLVQLYQHHYPNSSLAIQDKTEAIDFDFLVEDLPKVMSSMKMGAERIRAIVLSLRNFSRLDEAEMKFVDVHEGIDSTLLILNSQLKQGIEVIKQYENLPLIECYPAQLNQVFMNILSNAIDALLSQADKHIKQIVIETKIIKTNQVEVKLRDNGPGISEQVKTKIFDPFFTTKPVGKGTGLGLAICYQIIEKHRGRIEVNSRLGEGTEFLIVLPVAQFL